MEQETSVVVPSPTLNRKFALAAVAGLVLMGIAVVALSPSVTESHVTANAKWFSTTFLDDANTPCPHLQQVPRTPDVVPQDIIPSLDQKWKLQLPCEDDECAKDYAEISNTGVADVSPSELATYDLIPRMYTVDDQDYCSGGFYASTDEHDVPMVVLNNPVAGVTTSGSQNPRVELREMNIVDGHEEEAAFPITDSSRMEPNMLRLTTRIVDLPPATCSNENDPDIKPGNALSRALDIDCTGEEAPSGEGTSGHELCFGQLFLGDVDPPAKNGAFIELITKVCTYSYQLYPNGTRCPKGTLAIMVWKDGQAGGTSGSQNFKGIDGGMVLAPYTLGTKFDFEMTVPGNGSITFMYRPEGGDAVHWVAPCLNGSNCTARTDNGGMLYFKAGSYVQQAPDEPIHSYALSYLYSLSVTGG